MATNPYVEARGQWDERYADLLLGKRNWQIAASGLLAATLALPYMVAAGRVVPAVLISGTDADLPGPILGQVSQNVFHSATGKYIPIPQGRRLIGAYQNASKYGQRRVQIAWQRLNFPNTSSINLPQIRGTDRNGCAGFGDQADNHYLATFGNAALMSLISAGQMVGQMTAFRRRRNLRTIRLLPPNSWQWRERWRALQLLVSPDDSALQMIGSGLNRSPTIEIRPGDEFNVIATQDLVFAGRPK